MAIAELQSVNKFRGDLLAPLQSIIELSDGMLAILDDATPPGFAVDLRNVNSQGRELLEHVLRTIGSAPDRHAQDLSDAAVRSRVRHDMLNRLNAIINYSEMWLDDSTEEGLNSILVDLATIASLGKRCVRLVDAILNPAEAEEPVISIPKTSHFDASRAVIIGRILIVDDSELNRDILRRLLETRGHSVLCASSGAMALAMLEEQSVDTILLDMVMPDMNGVEVLHCLKADERWREIPVLIVSALADMECIVECIRSGAEDYLTRPISPVFLHARLSACLERKRLREKEQLYVRALDEERRRADELLHVILPAEVVGELKETKRVRPQRYEGVAVLFADIVNFTPYCEKHTPEEVVDQLQSVFEEWEEAALEHGIQKIKTIGDAFMAACGLLVPIDNPVLSTVQFGLNMIEIVERMQTGWRLRVGIHYGSLVAGVLGRRQFLFDLFGDTVNTASRMESHGVPGAIVMSGAARAQIVDDCSTMQLESIPVKGKGNIDRYQILSCHSHQQSEGRSIRRPESESPMAKVIRAGLSSPSSLADQLLYGPSLGSSLTCDSAARDDVSTSGIQSGGWRSAIPPR